MANENNTRTGIQRIEDLEQAASGIYQSLGMMSRDLTTAREAIKLLGNKLDAVVKASTQGLPLNDENLTKIMIDNNVEELKQKVDNLVVGGFLAAEDAVTENSFVVGQEVNEEGTVVNPRMQFALASVADEGVRNKIKEGIIGETLFLQEGKLRFKIMESYQITSPAVPKEETSEGTLPVSVGGTEETQPATEAPAPVTSETEAAPQDDSAAVVNG